MTPSTLAPHESHSPTSNCPVDDLGVRVEAARTRIAVQFDPALTDALSDEELAAERRDVEAIRRRERSQRRRVAKATIKAKERRALTALRADAEHDRVQAEIAATELRDQLRATRALADHQRSTSQHAQVADLYAHRNRSALAIGTVVVGAMLISATNVQHNLAPNTTMADPGWWTAYFIEALVSVCLIVLMVGTPKAEQWGITEGKGKIIAAEGLLFTLTVLLNTFPYIGTLDLAGFGTHVVAPTMIGVAILIHHAMSQRYGRALEKATAQLLTAAAEVPPAMSEVHEPVHLAADVEYQSPATVAETVDEVPPGPSTTSAPATEPTPALPVFLDGPPDPQWSQGEGLRAPTESREHDWSTIADKLSTNTRTPETVAQVLHLTFDRGLDATAVAQQVGLREFTVTRIVGDSHPYRLASTMAS